MDFEDFVEEVKFQMTEYDILEEEIIFDWEDRAREWLEIHEEQCNYIKRKGEDVLVKVPSEEICEDVARKYYIAVKNKQVDGYWDHFQLI